MQYDCIDNIATMRRIHKIQLFYLPECMQSPRKSKIDLQLQMHDDLYKKDQFRRCQSEPHQVLQQTEAGWVP